MYPFHVYCKCLKLMLIICYLYHQAAAEDLVGHAVKALEGGLYDSRNNNNNNNHNTTASNDNNNSNNRN